MASTKQQTSIMQDGLIWAGLSIFWLTTYAIVCAVNGKMPAVTDREIPSSLFSIGGVFSMDRPVLEVVWRTTCAALFGIAALGICDLCYARYTKARWFALHVIANAWIAVLSLPDLYLILTDPVHTLSQRVTPNHWPTSLVFSVHVYHMAFFRNLDWVDWLHHILMVVIGAPLLITGELGPLMNFNHFFMCGVPGGIDYAMLFAVKHGWMKPLSEKGYNAAINVWIREPALVAVATLGFMQLHLQPSKLFTWITAVRVFLMALCCWNGLFFMERVVGNYHVNAYKDKVAAREKESHSQIAKGGAPKALPPSPDAYETEEHIAVGLPGLGMRVNVSKQDLTEINEINAQSAAEHTRAAPRAEAYPASADNGKQHYQWGKQHYQ